MAFRMLITQNLEVIKIFKYICTVRIILSEFDPHKLKEISKPLFDLKVLKVLTKINLTVSDRH